MGIRLELRLPCGHPTNRSKMGLLDKVKGLIGKNADKVEGAIDKAADVADDKTGGKYSDKIDSGADKAKDIVDGLGDKGDAEGGAGEG